MGDRGLVTVELALSLVVVVIVLTMACWALMLVLVQLACLDTATTVARQAARGDRGSVARAKAAAPVHATVAVTWKGDQIRVAVRDRVALPGGLLPPVTLSAQVAATAEPGVKP